MTKENNVSWCTSESENRTIVKSNYIDENISLQVFFIRRKVDLDKINKKYLRIDAKHPDFWDEWHFPIILYKLKDKIHIDDNGDKKEDRFTEIIYDLHYDFNIKYMNGIDIQPQVKKFHISDSILMIRNSFEKNYGTLMEYIENPDYPENPLNLYKSVKYYINQYVDCDDWIVTGKALWSFGTHVYSIFDVYPYLYFLAHRGSGKSRTLRTLSLICRLGKMFVVPTLSPLFRTADSLSPTLFLDEVEYMNSKDKAELINWLNATFQKGAKVPRTDIDKKVVEDFEGYCPKAIASTKPIHPTLESRCLFLPIQRTLNLDQYATNEPKTYHGEELNLRLTFWALNNGSRVYSEYINDDLSRPYTQLLNLATPRIRQLIKPLLLIAFQLKIHELEGEFENLKKFIEYQNQHAISESVDSADRRIIAVLYNIVGETEITMDIGTKEIIESLGLEIEAERKYFTPIRIGNILKRFHIENHEINGRKKYLVNSAILTEIIQRYNIAVDNIDDNRQPGREGKPSIDSFTENKGEVHE